MMMKLLWTVQCIRLLRLKIELIYIICLVKVNNPIPIKYHDVSELFGYKLDSLLKMYGTFYGTFC